MAATWVAAVQARSSRTWESADTSMADGSSPSRAGGTPSGKGNPSAANDGQWTRSLLTASAVHARPRPGNRGSSAAATAVCRRDR